MNTPTHPLASALLLLNRLTLGLYVAAAGAGALIGAFSGEFVKNSFINLQPAWLPTFLARPLDYAIDIAAIVFGVMLALGVFTRVAAWGLVVVGAVVLWGLVDAHGFSGGSSTWLHHYVVMISLAMLLAAIGPGAFSVDQTFRRKTWS